MRIIHHPSGARGESREERSQLQNKKAAFLRMIDTPKFKLWMARETGRIAAADAEVQRIQVPGDQIKVEVRRNGHWVEVQPTELRS